MAQIESLIRFRGRLKPGAKDVIFIDKSVTDPVMQQRVIQHELCHAEMFRLYGNPYWHKE